MARRNMGGRGVVVEGQQKYCPVQAHPLSRAAHALRPQRLDERNTETPRMRSAHVRNVGNPAYPGDRSLAGRDARVYEKGRVGQTRSSGGLTAREEEAAEDLRARQRGRADRNKAEAQRERENRRKLREE